MKKIILICSSLLIVVMPVLSQINEPGTFQFLQDSFAKRNSDVREYLIEQCHLYLNTFWDSNNSDEVLFMLGKLYEEDDHFADAFLAFLQIKYIFPKSDRRNDAVSSLNQIIHNKAERIFEKKRKAIDEMVSQTISFNDRNIAHYECLKFCYELSIEELNEVLPRYFHFYVTIENKNVKNIDQITFWIAEIYKKLSDWEEAVLAFQKVRFLDPESILIPQTLYQIGLIQYQEIREYQMAKDTFIRLITDYPETPIAGDAQFYLAELFEEKLDDNNEAVSNYRVLVETYPDNRFAVESLKRVAEIMKDRDNYEEAIASYYQIVELYPKNKFSPDALLEIEYIYRRRLNNYEKSIEILKLFASQYPEREDAPERLYDAAELYIDELNNKQSAIDTFHEVVNQFPNSKYAKRAKDKIADLSEE